VSRSGKRTRVGAVAACALATVLAGFVLFPVYVLGVSSLKPLAQVFDLRLFPPLGDLTLQNYVEVLRTQSFGRYILNSAIVSSVVTLAALWFHSMAGYAFARLRFRGRTAIFIWMLCTMMIPFAVIMIPLFIIVRSLGMANSLWGIIVPMIPNAYGVFFFRQFYLGLPRELEESAKIDGASNWLIYRAIIVPLSTTIALTLATTFFLTNWNRYLWPLIVNQKKQFWVVQVAIATFRDDKEVAWNLILAASCITALPTILLFAIFQRYLVEGIKMSGVKA